MQHMRFPSISVVVLTYNNWAYTEACLNNLLQCSDYPGRLEIVVTDNASSDETVERLKVGCKGAAHEAGAQPGQPGVFCRK